MIRPIVVAVVLAGMSSAVVAQDFQVGSRAKAMGGSYTAFGDDPVAIWTNPAGTATQPSQVGVTYQSFTQYEFNHLTDVITLPTRGEAEQGLLDPPVAPSFAGVVVRMGEGGDVEMAASIAYIRPFQIKYTYDYFDPDPANNLITQTDQQFTRIRAAYGVSFRTSDSPFFKTLALGLGVDFVFSHYKEVDQSPDPARDSQIFEDSESSIGYGAGVLITGYESDSFRVDVGAAWNSAVSFHWDLDPVIYPVWDWPALGSAGFAFYIGEGYPLRVTVDMQWIGWKRAVAPPDIDPATGKPFDHFRNTYSFSAGAEYRFKVGEKNRLFARIGLKSYDTPWKDKNYLPAVGLSRLDIDTKGDRVQMMTMGFGFYWTRKTWEGESRSSGIDFAVELFGETQYLFGVSFTYQFD